MAFRNSQIKLHTLMVKRRPKTGNTNDILKGMTHQRLLPVMTENGYGNDNGGNNRFL